MLTTPVLILYVLFFGNAFNQADSALKTTFIDDLCYNSKISVLDLRYENSGILMAAPRGEGVDCEVVLSPPKGAHVVISIYRYDLHNDDVLIIEDSDRHRLALMGYGVFRDEKKSVISEGKMRIFYKTSNETVLGGKRAGFQFTYTKVMKSGPCSSNEFKCENSYCVLKNYMCDGHNHCGDNSDQKKCGLDIMQPELTIAPPHNTPQVRGIIFFSLMGIGALILLIVIIVFIVYVVKGAKLKKEWAKSPVTLQAVSPTVPITNTVPATVPQQPPTAPAPDNSFYNRVRRSFRSSRPSPSVETHSTQNSSSENYQVPSMYPSLDAHEMHGMENSDFRIEE